MGISMRWNLFTSSTTFFEKFELNFRGKILSESNSRVKVYRCSKHKLFGFSDVKTCFWIFQILFVLHWNKAYISFLHFVLHNNDKVSLWSRNLFASNTGISVCGCSKDKVVEDWSIGGHPNTSSYHHRHLVMIIVMLMVMMERRRRTRNKKRGRFDFIQRFTVK